MATQDPISYNVDDVVRDIRITLDNNMSSKALADLGDVDTLSLDDIVKSKICPAARIVETAAPYLLLGRGEAFTGTIYWPQSVGMGSGHIQLPDDFLRLVCFQMSDWDRPVFSAIGEDSPEYIRQSSKYGGIRGNTHRPVVAVVHWSTGLELEFYSCTAGAGVYVKRARYIPIPKITADKVNLCEKLYDAIVLKAASMVAQTYQEKDLVTYLEGQCKELLAVNT